MFNYNQRPITPDYSKGYDNIRWEGNNACKSQENPEGKVSSKDTGGRKGQGDNEEKG
jgi:hypothetical protein